jgi:hypothetical protein
MAWIQNGWENGLAGMHRILQPGGKLATASWMKVGWVPDFEAAFKSSDEVPDFPPYEQIRQVLSPGGDWDDSAWTKNAFEKSKFTDVSVIEIPYTTQNDREEFGQMTNSMLGLLQQRLWTEEQREKYGARSIEIVHDYMKKKYGDSKIEWHWVAILATGTKAA